MQTVTLPRALVDDLARALNNTVSQIELYTDPGIVTRQVYEHAQGTLDTLKHRLSAHTGDQAEKGDGQAATALRDAMEAFGGPLRLATLCLENATDDDLTALERLHVLDLACVVDDWKDRAERRMVTFEKSGPEKSGTG